jgi:hypothetical protein
MRQAGIWYDTDPDDPEAPVRLTEYNGLRDGMAVRYRNPHSRVQLTGPLTVSAIYRFKDADGQVVMVQAILNEGEYEVSADNLEEEVLCPFLHMRPCRSDCPSMRERACIIGEEDHELHYPGGY